MKTSITNPCFCLHQFECIRIENHSEEMKSKSIGTTQKKHRLPTMILLVVFVLVVLFPKWRLGQEYGTKTEQVQTLVESLSVTAIRESLLRMGETPLYDASLESTSDPAWKLEILQRLDRIRLVCGKLCQLNSLEKIKEHTSIDSATNASFVVVKDVNCPALLNSKDLDAASLRCKESVMWKDNVPKEIEKFFTLNGATELEAGKGRCDIFMTTKAGDPSRWKTGNVWGKEDIEAAMDEIRAGTHRGTYGAPTTSGVRDILKTADVSGKSIMVIGSSAPWLEATLLVLGAQKVTTLEYGELISEHPKIVTMTPDVFQRKYQEGTLEMFDGVVSFSSLEHSGLGRYGDAVNPWGDILAVARAWCVTKSGGWMYLGLPSGKVDGTYSNYHRLYSRIRWPLVTTNWVPVHKNYTLNLHRSRGRGHVGFVFRKVD
jgi:Caenorhabditis protein of unknown function, DUF268